MSEPNVAIAARSHYTPSDTLFPDQWHLFNTGGPSVATASHIDALHAWDLTRGERSVIVAVADDSCDLNHTDFQGSAKIVAPRDFAGQDFEPLPELEDDNHGTACCGVAVAEETGTGVVGVAPGCALMPIRTSGYIDDTSIEDLCDWVIDPGASVMSCSWGVNARYFSLTLRMRTALHRAATLGRGGKGCVVVFASGNENRPVNGTVNETGWPDNQPSGPTQWLAGFAAHEDVIGVAASSSLATKSAYSNWGPEIAVCAPSNNVGPRTYPHVTVAVNGRGIVTTDRVGPSGYSSTDYTRNFGGTSSACPTVAGVAALVLSANPNLTAGEVRDILQSTSDKIVDNNPDPQLGNRFGTYDANGHSRWFGFGRVNALKAATEARRRLQGATGQTVRKSSSPALAIPDHDPAGARNSIRVDDAGNLASIKVSVDISHTFIGDLRLTLIAPSGKQSVLHDRNGGSADNIRRSYDLATTPGLSAFVGDSIKGDWVLWVQDLAAADSGLIQDLEVSVDITHTYIGDLTITLVSPGGTQVVLHSRSGGSQDNLVAQLPVCRHAGAAKPARAIVAGCLETTGSRPRSGGRRQAQSLGGQDQPLTKRPTNNMASQTLSSSVATAQPNLRPSAGPCGNANVPVAITRRPVASVRSVRRQQAVSNGSLLLVQVLLIRWEADRLADQAIGNPAHSAVSGLPLHIQRYAGQAAEGASTASASDTQLSGNHPKHPGKQIAQSVHGGIGHE